MGVGLTGLGVTGTLVVAWGVDVNSRKGSYHGALRLLYVGGYSRGDWAEAVLTAIATMASDQNRGDGKRKVTLRS